MHQTGNPRRFDFPQRHILKTAAVSMVEAQLHRRFSKSMVRGKWFSFNEQRERSSAIDHAKNLAVESKALVSIPLEADRLQKLPSTEALIPAS